MSDRSKIEWCDATWNVTAGCSKISEGCRFCYAERFSCRLAAMEMKRVHDGKYKYANVVRISKGSWTGEIFCDEKALEHPLHWRKPCRIFVCSMSDLFHPKVPFGFVDKVFALGIGFCPENTFLILTKRIKRMLRYFKKFYKGLAEFRGVPKVKPLKNVHLGVSISTQDEMWKAKILTDIPATVRYISFEPLLADVGEIDCLWKFRKIGGILKPHIDWIIVGGESGPGARPMHPEWVCNIRDQCVAAGVPFYFKQWGAWEIANKENAARNEYVVSESRQGFLTPYNTEKFINLNRDGSNYQNNQQPNSIAMARVGKKKAGRILDGKIWNQLPERGIYDPQ